MKELLCFVLLFCACFSVSSQTNIHYRTFGDNATQTQDACVFSLYPNNTYPTEEEFNMLSWTWQSRPGTVRTLLRFDQINNIPNNAIILSATLHLKGVSSGNITPQGNSYYNGSYVGYPSNEVSVGLLTQHWNENTVTWNTQPAFDASSVITMPASTLQWNDDFILSSPALVSMVQQMVEHNYGFMFKLVTEQKYRSRIFGSSDNVNEKMRPTLSVSYIYCDADFTYCSSSANRDDYHFTALNTEVLEYVWTVNGEEASAESELDCLFSEGDTNEVCLSVIDENELACEKCVTIITSYQDMIEEEFAEKKTTSVVGKLPQADVIQMNVAKVYPNPSNGTWNLEILNDDFDSGKYEIRLKDAEGNVIEHRKVYNRKEIIEPSVQKNGIYILELLCDEDLMFSEKLICID